MANTTEKISFEHKGIGDCLAHYRLVVPLNQREYSWQDEPDPLTPEDSERLEQICFEISTRFYAGEYDSLREYHFETARIVMQAERSRCIAACLSEMGGDTFGEVNRVQAVEKKVKSGWTPEGLK